MNTTQPKSRFLLKSLAAALAALALSSGALAREPVGPTLHPIAGQCTTNVTTLESKGPGQSLRIDGNCYYREIGPVKIVGNQSVTPAGPPNGALPPIFIITTITDTTFQGDAFNSVFTGGGELDLATGEVQFAGVETFNGGTGRFRTATGNASDMGQADTVAAHGSFTTSGAIRY